MNERTATIPVGRSLSRLILLGLVLIYLALAGALACKVPRGEAPDEGASLQYVKYVADNGRLPVFDWSHGADRIDYEYHQPPLYFALCVPGWKLLPESQHVYLCRAVNIACCALIIVLIWQSVAELFPENGELRILAAGFVSLWPLNQAVGVTAGNDALAGTLAAAIFYMVARGARRGWKPGDSLLMGTLLGLGLLTKSTCLVFAPVALGAAWSLGRRGASGDTRAGLSEAAKVLGVAIVLCGWWLARNQHLYGDPFAAKVFDAAFRQTSPRPSDVLATTGISVPGYLRALATIMFCTAWGFFGGPNLALGVLRPFSKHGPLPEIMAGVIVPAIPAMIICAAATLLSFLGFLVWTRRHEPLTEPVGNALRWWVIGFFLVVAAWVQFNTIQFQAQARYIHPATLPIALGFALGAQAIFPRSILRWAAAGVFAITLVGLTLWNILGWQTLN